MHATMLQRHRPSTIDSTPSERYCTCTVGTTYSISSKYKCSRYYLQAAGNLCHPASNYTIITLYYTLLHSITLYYTAITAVSVRKRPVSNRNSPLSNRKSSVSIGNRSHSSSNSALSNRNSTLHASTVHVLYTFCRLLQAGRHRVSIVDHASNRSAILMPICTCTTQT